MSKYIASEEQHFNRPRWYVLDSFVHNAAYLLLCTAKSSGFLISVRLVIKQVGGFFECV